MIELTFEKSRVSACFDFKAPMTLPISFIDDAPDDFMVTLNRTAEIAPGKIIDKYNYAHPVFTMDGVAAQKRHDEISNKNRTHFCGAYWFNGFHEDGVNSALRVAKAFDIEL